MQRVAGTAAGVVAGLVIAAALAGHTYGELGLLFVCVFVAFYYVQTAYQIMVFFITVMVSLLYSLLGEFSFGLLSLRLEETAIGAVIGGVVALAVLPQHSREPISRTVSDALRDLAALLEEAGFPAADRASLLDRSRALDAGYQRLRTLARPLAILPGTRARQTRTVAVAVGALAYHAREIAGRAPAGGDDGLAREVAGHARAVAGLFAGGGEPDPDPDPAGRDGPPQDLPRRLRAIDRAISFLAGCA